MPFPSPTMCGVDLKQQCSPAASSPVGAIGILSHEPRGRMRDTLRVTWLRELGPGLEARFVIRGAPLADAGATCGEAETHNDIFFVNAPSDLRRENGPLLSFVLWLRCAMLAFPRAPFVGKADDDVWVAARWVHHTLSQLSSLHWQQPYTYVGGFEQYHWRPDVDAPARWSNGVQRESCRDRPSEGADHWLHGPFSFAKGALFLLSRPLATRLSGQGSSRHESRYAAMPRTRSYSPREHAEAITAGDPLRCVKWSKEWFATREQNGSACQREVWAAWEDVWVGYAVSRLALPSLMLVNVGGQARESLFRDAHGLVSSPATVVWHSKIDDDFPRRAAIIHRWWREEGARECSESHVTCSSVPLLEPRSRGNVTTCAKASLRLCHARQRRKGCSHAQLSLWGLNNTPGRIEACGRTCVEMILGE